MIPNVMEQLAIAFHLNLGVAEFTNAGTLNLATQLLCHGLHTIADTQHGHAQGKYTFRSPW